MQLQKCGALAAAEACSCQLLLWKLHWQQPYIHEGSISAAGAFVSSSVRLLCLQQQQASRAEVSVSLWVCRSTTFCCQELCLLVLCSLSALHE
jgi:hypothetical protein